MKIAGIIGSVIVLSAATCLLMAWPFMWIWNYAVVSAVTVTKPIGYWVAFWLMLFVSLFVAGSKSSVSRSA